jgi:hypothetical protein
MAIYLNIGLQPDSPAQRPESLYRQPRLMWACVVCSLVMIVCLYVDMPWLDQALRPLGPTR